MLLNCLFEPKSSCMSNVSCPSSCTIRFPMFLAPFSVISWSLMSSTLATSDIEGRSSSTLFSITPCQAVAFPLGMLKPNLQSLFFYNIHAIAPADLSVPSLVIEGMFMSSISDFEMIIMKFFWGFSHAFR